MQIKIVSEFQSDRDIGAVKTIVNKCVHCGFCTATCPTYQVLGDELDGPRGRIYLMKKWSKARRSRPKPRAIWIAV